MGRLRRELRQEPDARPETESAHQPSHEPGQWACRKSAAQRTREPACRAERRSQHQRDQQPVNEPDSRRVVQAPPGDVVASGDIQVVGKGRKPALGRIGIPEHRQDPALCDQRRGRVGSEVGCA